ncbi:uncharacterized protein Z519_00446 [Cladophialophora bantiana CBS 173.52]|uniref:Heterokaryon incompatibility domain-containing protein n=1 Tax=Cladophialophora bantiana (strain ATCC 10958 / CBS 173.52 / CDC B-1940 / NIH 8579) TaxID=1442370 RepID=A0A0D2HZ83_CLAB1|nr:uncharacterized protein Z519_00446 [Cladophialophora bantiana CBS 173.52]KIW98783.1 hypothetical protein Z519_00446 [Cladophialophora bantiana CBS 173.52]
MSMFKYEPISRDVPSIRLLRLLRGPAEIHPWDSSGIKCEFELTHLDDDRDVQYDAISYAWGDDERTQTIQLSGKPFMVSKIVEDILLRLRVPDRDRLLWIDAICINQGNLAEKDHQVDRMRDVFAQAQTVIASLGPHREVDEYGQPGISYKLHSALKLVKSSRSTFGSAVKLKLSSTDEYCLLQLLQVPWFKRIWVIQEVAVAKRLLIVSGRNEVEGHYFAKLHRRFLPRVQNKKLRSKLEELGPLLGFMGSEIDSEAKSELLDLLQHFRSWNSTNPRDRIYALRGLAIDGLEVPELKPNYKLPVQTVYERVARYMIKRYESLAVLTYAVKRPQPAPAQPEGWIPWILRQFQGETPLQQIPVHLTWCPDWRDPYTLSNDPEPVSRQRASLPAPRRQRRSSPVHGSSGSPEDPEPLRVKGYAIGVVTSVFDGNIEASPFPAIKQQIPEWPYNRISKHLKELHASLIDSAARQLEFEYNIKAQETTNQLEAQWRRKYGCPTDLPVRIRMEAMEINKVHKCEPQPQDGLIVDDQLCILQGSTGLAILRPEGDNHFSLIVLEHSDYPRVNLHLFDNLSAGGYAESSVFGEIVHRLSEISIRDGWGRGVNGTDAFCLV